MLMSHVESCSRTANSGFVCRDSCWREMVQTSMIHLQDINLLMGVSGAGCSSQCRTSLTACKLADGLSCHCLSGGAASSCRGMICALLCAAQRRSKAWEAALQPVWWCSPEHTLFWAVQHPAGPVHTYGVIPRTAGTLPTLLSWTVLQPGRAEQLWGQKCSFSPCLSGWMTAISPAVTARISLPSSILIHSSQSWSWTTMSWEMPVLNTCVKGCWHQAVAYRSYGKAPLIVLLYHAVTN